MSMPFLPLYVTDYEADTAHLSLEEDGIYMRLLRLCWRTPGCSIPTDPAWITRMLRITEDQFERHAKPVLGEFFVAKGGRYTQPRLLREHDKATRTCHARKESGSRGGKAKALKSREIDPSKPSSKTVANLYHLEPDIELYIPNTNVFGSEAAVEQVSVAVEDAVEEPVEDLSRILWGRWVRWMIECGVAERAARSMIGKWRKVTDDMTICRAFEDAQREGVVDPIPWMRVRLEKPVVDLNKIAMELGNEWTASS